jgi:hypothetical protein
MKVSDKPVLLPLAFQIYRVSHKVYVEALHNVPGYMQISLGGAP